MIYPSNSMDQKQSLEWLNNHKGKIIYIHTLILRRADLQNSFLPNFTVSNGHVTLMLGGIFTR